MALISTLMKAGVEDEKPPSHHIKRPAQPSRRAVPVQLPGAIGRGSSMCVMRAGAAIGRRGRVDCLDDWDEWTAGWLSFYLPALTRT